MDDPSKMSDEELKAAIEPQPEETPTNEEAPVASPEEEAPEQPTETEPAEEAGLPETPEQAEAPPISRREQLRVADLLKKYGPPAETKPDIKGMDYNTAFDPETPPEVIKQFEDDRRVAVESSFNQGLEQAKSIQFHTRLEIDAPRVETKYPKLDPNSDQFQPEAADDLNQLYLNVVGYDPQTDRVANPNIRYADFVDAYMGNVNRLASEQAAETTKQVIRQAAQTGLRPDGSSAKGMDLSKHPSEMTDEELNAAITAAPRDSRGRFTAR